MNTKREEVIQIELANDLSLFGLLAIAGSFLIIIFAIVAVMFVLRALALYTMAKNQNISNPWLAWIPLAQDYLFGMVLRQKITVTSSFSIPYAQWVLIAVNVLSATTYGRNIINAIVFILSIVINMLALFRLYKLYAPDQAVPYTVFSFLIPVTIPIFMIIIRNNQPIEYDTTEFDDFNSTY